MSHPVDRLARRVERLFGGATPAFRAQVVAPFLDDWRREADAARRRGARAAGAVRCLYLSRLPALGWAALVERSRPMPTLRPPQLAARALYVAAVGLLFVIPRLTGDAAGPAELVVSLAALLGLGLGLVAVGLLLEARDRRSGLAAGG